MANQAPLERISVLVTRACHQSSQLKEKLMALGADCVEIPVIEIAPPASWAALDEALENISRYNWLIFASTNAVSACLNRLASLRKSKDILSKTKIAAIGPATARAARLARLKIAFQPESFIGESLVAEFPGYPELEGCCILWPRTNVGREYVLNCLEKAGARVDTVEAYRTIMPANSNELAGRLATLLKDRKIDVITLASSQTARNLARLIRLALATGQDEKEPLAQKMRNLLDSVTIASIGPQTSQTAVEEFGRADLQAREYTIDGLVAALVEYIQQNALHPT